MHQLTAILIALWAGSLWALCGLVAPALFATLDDRRLAGQIAATLFRLEAWLGLAIALALTGVFVLRKGSFIQKGPLGLIALTAAAPVASELVLGPMMDAARAAGDMARFGRLHGLAAALFLIACAGALALVWKLSRRAE